MQISEVESPTLGVFEQVSSDFNYERNKPNFEAVNVYYHINKALTYVNEKLGYKAKPLVYQGGVKVDPHGENGGFDMAIDLEYLVMIITRSLQK